MQEQFLDRLLTCVDCHGEFIFTAGEQLFFFDKQFKNDPKRCKPCKSRRSGLAAAANGTGPAAAGLSRTETRTTCSECGIETTVPFKPTQGRPVLCRQCFQMKSRATPSTAQTPEPTSLVSVEAMDRQASAVESGPLLASLATLLAAAVLVPAAPPTSVATGAEIAYVESLDTASGWSQNALPMPAAPPLEVLSVASAELSAASLDTPAAILRA